MFEVWLQMSDTNIDTENPNDLPALVYNDLFVFLEPVDEPRPTCDCGQLMQGSSD